MTASAPTPRKLRILIAKPGLDGHDRGAKVVARALRDAGFEVIYTGLHQTPVPEADFERLRAAGVTGVFTPGTTLETIIQWVRDNVRPRV